MSHSPTPPRAGQPSPWGTIHIANQLADGIVDVDTSTHGGIWLSPERLALMDPSERSTDGWYEKMNEAAFPLRRFRSDVIRHYAPGRLDNFIGIVMAFSDGYFFNVAMNRDFRDVMPAGESPVKHYRPLPIIDDPPRPRPDEPPHQPVCTDCGSNDVLQRAWAAWNNRTQSWQLLYVRGLAVCQSTLR